MKTLFTLCLAFISFYTFSQTTAPTKKDTLTQVDGTKYIGTLISTTISGDNTGEVAFKTEDGQVHQLSSSSIAHLKRANEVLDDKLPPADKKTAVPTNVSAGADDGTSINWSDPKIPHRVVKKHNVGIGLTVSGTLLTGVGIGMLAGGIAANGQTSTYTGPGTAQASVNVGAVGVVGVLMIIAGLPMTIVGAVKIAKSKRRARANLIHYN